jgi:hypothetical protein
VCRCENQQRHGFIGNNKKAAFFKRIRNFATEITEEDWRGDFGNIVEAETVVSVY